MNRCGIETSAGVRLKEKICEAPPPRRRRKRCAAACNGASASAFPREYAIMTLTLSWIRSYDTVSSHFAPEKRESCHRRSKFMATPAYKLYGLCSFVFQCRSSYKVHIRFAAFAETLRGTHKMRIVNRDTNKKQQMSGPSRMAMPMGRFIR
eukprot:6202532-Pleurochrysis_carterae.AAC.2